LAGSFSPFVLALSTRWIRYQQLLAANVVVSAFLPARSYNYDLRAKFWGPISLRIFTISFVLLDCTSLAQSRT